MAEPRLSVAVMTHAARRERAAALVAGLEPGRVRVVADPAPERGPATIRTARVAWAAARADASHHLVLQDDVIPVPDLLRRVRTAVRARPRHALAFFTEWGSRTSMPVRAAALCGYRWAEVIDAYVPTPALALPTALARAAARHLETLPEDTHDDVALYAFLRRSGVPAWVSVPNLVEHDDGPSLIGNEPMGRRRSACPAPPDAARRGDGRVLRGLTVVPSFSWWSTAACCWVRASPAATTWHRTTATTYATRSGITEPALHALADTNLPDLNGLVPRPALHDLAICAFSLGLLAATHAGATPDPAVSRAAVRSLAPGALRHHIDPRRQAEAFAALEPYVAAAVERGLTWAR